MKWVGRILEGRYDVLRIIGEGGMGMVFEARHRFTGAPVALKLLRPCFGQVHCIRQAFYREARFLGRLDHPNVCKAYDLGHTDEGYPFMVLPLLKGQHLADWLDDSESRFTWHRIEAIFTQILLGVVAVHDAGVVHGDLKPSNLWLGLLPDGREQVTIIDFGIASSTEEDPRSKGTGGVRGMVAGTPRYMAPERAQGETRLDGRMDVYSLGVVLLDLLTGEMTTALRCRQSKRERYTTAPRWSELSRCVCAPPQLADILARALAWNPAHRYASCRALRHAFFQVAHHTDPRSLEPAHTGPSDVHQKAG